MENRIINYLYFSIIFWRVYTLKSRPTNEQKKKNTMRVLEELKTYLNDAMIMDGHDNLQDVLKYINDFASIEKSKYEALKKDNKLTFGKWRGYTPKELNMTEKGRDYLSWLLSQDWIVESRQDLVKEITSIGIKKKSFKKTPLE